MRTCPRPLDPLDAEAVAAGADPVFASDAAAHAAQCGPCAEAVRSGSALSESLGDLSESSEAVFGLTERVLRLRAFSRRERRTYALWQGAILLDVVLFAAGFLLLALPVLTGSDQLTLGAAALAPLLALFGAAASWAIEIARVGPAGLEALSAGLRGETVLGLAALSLLIPAALGLRRVLSRAPGRR